MAFTGTTAAGMASATRSTTDVWRSVDVRCSAASGIGHAATHRAAAHLTAAHLTVGCERLRGLLSMSRRRRSARTADVRSCPGSRHCMACGRTGKPIPFTVCTEAATFEATTTGAVTFTEPVTFEVAAFEVATFYFAPSEAASFDFASADAIAFEPAFASANS
jgi:hypothetical protein